METISKQELEAIAAVFAECKQKLSEVTDLELYINMEINNHAMDFVDCVVIHNNKKFPLEVNAESKLSKNVDCVITNCSVNGVNFRTIA